MKKSFIHQQEEISFVKNTFTQYLKDKLEVVEVQGPILSKVGDGMQDNLSGVENPVSVKVLQIPDETYEVVHSLAKWKRHTLARFGFGEGEVCSSCSKISHTYVYILPQTTLTPLMFIMHLTKTQMQY